MSEFLAVRPTETCPIVHSFGNPRVTTTYKGGYSTTLVTFECQRCRFRSVSELTIATSQIADHIDKYTTSYAITALRGMYPPENDDISEKLCIYIQTLRRTVPKVYSELYTMYTSEIDDILSWPSQKTTKQQTRRRI